MRFPLGSSQNIGIIKDKESVSNSLVYVNEHSYNGCQGDSFYWNYLL